MVSELGLHWPAIIPPEDDWLKWLECRIRHDRGSWGSHEEHILWEAVTEAVTPLYGIEIGRPSLHLTIDTRKNELSISHISIKSQMLAFAFNSE